MDPRKLASALVLLAAPMLAIAFVWWFAVAIGVPREMRMSMLQLTPCLFHSAGITCGAFSVFGGYQPFVMWLGLMMLGAAWLISYSMADSPSSWGKLALDDIAGSVKRLLRMPQSLGPLATVVQLREGGRVPAGQANVYADRTIRLSPRDGGHPVEVSLRELERGAIVIGRGSTADRAVDRASVSRRHAMLWTDGHGAVVIDDLNSANGVWRDGQRISRASLRPGMLVRLGDAEFVVEMEPQAG